MRVTLCFCMSMGVEFTQRDYALGRSSLNRFWLQRAASGDTLVSDLANASGDWNMSRTTSKSEPKPVASKTWRGRPVYTEEDRKSMEPKFASEAEWVAELMEKKKKKAK